MVMNISNNGDLEAFRKRISTKRETIVSAVRESIKKSKLLLFGVAVYVPS